MKIYVIGVNLFEIHASNEKIPRMKKTHATKFAHIELKT